MEHATPGQTRYVRQTLLREIGREGQERLNRSRALIVGCGALGSAIADQLARAGVGFLRIADRDIVELSNLHRQILFDETDAAESLPKAVAAAARLAEINSLVRIEPLVVDVCAGNIERLCGLAGEEAGNAPVDLILDGTDNVETRYLINDVAVKHGIRWVYGGCVGTEGRAMAIVPGQTACLRCVFPQPPAAGQLPTCDTVGVLGPAAVVTGAIQAGLAIGILCDADGPPHSGLITFDLWRTDFRVLSLPERPDPQCVCCGLRRFDFLESRATQRAAVVCGQNAVQLAPPPDGRFDMESAAARLRDAAKVVRTPFFIRCEIRDLPGLAVVVFHDGRVIVQGTQDVPTARSIAARYVGT